MIEWLMLSFCCMCGFHSYKWLAGKTYTMRYITQSNNNNFNTCLWFVCCCSLLIKLPLESWRLWLLSATVTLVNHKFSSVCTLIWLSYASFYKNIYTVCFDDSLNRKNFIFQEFQYSSGNLIISTLGYSLFTLNKLWFSTIRWVFGKEFLQRLHDFGTVFMK